jgi:hypothetical protein
VEDAVVDAVVARLQAELALDVAAQQPPRPLVLELDAFDGAIVELLELVVSSGMRKLRSL